MLLGKRFFPETGTPIWKMARSRVLFAVWLPEPLTVAIWIEHSFTSGARAGVSGAAAGAGACVVVRGMVPRVTGVRAGRGEELYEPADGR
jgi:hypothetical protein